MAEIFILIYLGNTAKFRWDADGDFSTIFRWREIRFNERKPSLFVFACHAEFTRHCMTSFVRYCP